MSRAYGRRICIRGKVLEEGSSCMVFCCSLAIASKAASISSSIPENACHSIDSATTFLIPRRASS